MYQPQTVRHVNNLNIIDPFIQSTLLVIVLTNPKLSLIYRPIVVSFRQLFALLLTNGCVHKSPTVCKKVAEGDLAASCQWLG